MIKITTIMFIISIQFFSEFSSLFPLSFLPIQPPSSFFFHFFIAHPHHSSASPSVPTTSHHPHHLLSFSPPLLITFLSPLPSSPITSSPLSFHHTPCITSPSITPITYPITPINPPSPSFPFSITPSKVLEDKMKEFRDSLPLFVDLKHEALRERCV